MPDRHLGHPDTGGGVADRPARALQPILVILLRTVGDVRPLRRRTRHGRDTKRHAVTHELPHSGERSGVVDLDAILVGSRLHIDSAQVNA